MLRKFHIIAFNESRFFSTLSIPNSRVCGCNKKEVSRHLFKKLKRAKGVVIKREDREFIEILQSE